MEQKKSNLCCIITTITMAICIVVLSILYGLGVGYKTFPNAKLSSWEKEAQAKVALEGYVKDVTDKDSENFIPIERRIAVFDMDGTVFGERDPWYFDYMLLVYRVTQDPNYKDQASSFEKSVAQKILDDIAGVPGDYDDLADLHGQAVASAFKGMTLNEFHAYVQEFKKQPLPSFTGINRGDSWFKPMVEVIKYLKAYDFTVYIISGTDRLIVRGLIDNSPIDLPISQLIGSDQLVVSPKQQQAGIDGGDYTYNEDKMGDKLVLAGEFVIKNLKMNKVTVIAQEIGVQPVLSFGNSTGDAAMAQYTITDNPYKSMAFMVCCDDLVRENGVETVAQKMYGLCETYGWIPISMKNDWKTIYGDGVTKKQ